jgi:hypothetical protein
MLFCGTELIPIRAERIMGKPDQSSLLSLARGRGCQQQVAPFDGRNLEFLCKRLQKTFTFDKATYLATDRPFMGGLPLGLAR